MGVTASRSASYQLDDLRRFASGLASGLGMPPARASSLATHLLWFDAAGASSHGIATLPRLLEQIDRKEIDPVAEGRAGGERAGTAVFDAQNGVPLLAMERAAGIAAEKARDLGVGIVRVRNIGVVGPASSVAADLALGPFVAAIAGPGPSLALAMPSPQGLPVVLDTALYQSSNEWMTSWTPWITSLVGDDAWLVLALSVSAMESLTIFHERIASSFRDWKEQGGQLRPESWEARRSEARERGVSLDPGSVDGLKAWAERLQVPWPATFGG